MGDIRTINDIGIGKAGSGEELVRDIRVYEEGGSVQVWVEVAGRGKDFAKVHEAMQYLTPDEAMAFAKAFEACAIAALRNRA